MALMDQARREGKGSKKDKKGAQKGPMGDDSAIRNLDFHKKTLEELEKQFNVSASKVSSTSNTLGIVNQRGRTTPQDTWT